MKMHERLSVALAQSPRTQTEIAREAGFTRPNILSMMKRAQTRIPLTRIYPLANALDVDGDLWMALALAEYEPELYALLRPHLTLPANAKTSFAPTKEVDGVTIVVDSQPEALAGAAV